MINILYKINVHINNKSIYCSRLFFDHLGTILLMAVVGTIFNVITIGKFKHKTSYKYLGNSW